MSNNLDKTYTSLLQDILDNGVEKKDRTGTGTLSVFGRQIRHNMSEGFPLLTTKKMAWKTMVVELLWFLRGDTNIKYLVDNGCHVWDGDCFANYVRNFPKYVDSLPENSEAEFIINKDKFINRIKTDDEFAKKWGELGPIYGKQWRSWKSFEHEYGEDENGDGFIGMWKGKEKIDQITNLINELKTNPDSRRLMVNAWNVGEIDQMVLPPCHYGFQVYTKELSLEERWKFYYKKDLDINRKHGEWDSFEQSSQKNLDILNVPTRAISLMWNQRSVDTFLGLPFNIASYGLLLMMIADEVNMVPDELIGNLGNVHLYLNHIEQAKEQIGRELSEDERYNLLTKQMTKLRAIKDEDYIKYNIPTRTREPYPLPTVHVRDGIFCSSVNDVILENYQSHPTIKAPLSN
jgi:thymidylate synthase